MLDVDILDRGAYGDINISAFVSGWVVVILYLRGGLLLLSLSPGDGGKRFFTGHVDDSYSRGINFVLECHYCA